MAREREEDVVQGRPAQADVVHRDALVPEPPDDVDELLGASPGGDRQPPRVLVDRRGAVRRQELGRVSEQGAVVDDDLDPLAAHLRLELVGGAARDDPAVVDDGDLVGELVRLLEVLRRQEQRRSLAHLVADHVPHPEAAAGVEAGRGLVEEEEPRSADERGGEVEAAAHAAGVRLRDPVGGVLEVEPLQELPCALLRLGRAELVEASEHPEVLAAGEVLVDGCVLAGEPDQAPHCLGLTRDVEPRDGRPAGVGTEQRRENAHGRGLARAVRAEQPEHRAFPHLEIDAVERPHLAAPRAEHLDEPFCLDHSHAPTLAAAAHPAYLD